MVRRQGSRFGVSTNHSVRRSNASKQEVNQYVVVKTMSNVSSSSKGSKRVLSEYSQQIHDGNLAVNSDRDSKQNQVLYSLNKHKRWELPEMLKENILDEENHLESKFQVTLSERHIGASGRDTGTQRGGDCIAVHQSKSDDPQRLPKKTYSFETDLAGPDKKTRRKRQRKNKSKQMETERENEEAVVTEEDLTPEIHYEVCYPRPRNKYQNYGKASKNNEVTVKSGKKSSKKAQLGWLEWTDDGLDDFEEFDDEAFHFSTPHIEKKEQMHASESSLRLSNDHDVYTSNYSPVTLGNVLVTLLIDAVCAENEQSNPRPKRRHRSKTSVSSLEDSDLDAKDHIKVIDREDAERFQPKDDEPETPKPINRRTRKRARRRQNETQPEPEPEQVEKPTPVEDLELKIVKKISVNSLKSDNLHGTFGACFVEGHCCPRRFVINLKPAVEEHLKDKGHDRIAKTLMESCRQMILLFEPFGCIEGVIGSNQPAYQQVRLKVHGLPQDVLNNLRQFTQDECLCDCDSYPWSSIKLEDPTVKQSEHDQLCVISIWTVQQIVDYFQRKIRETSPESFYQTDGAIGWAARQPPVTLETVQTVSQVEWKTSLPSEIIQSVQGDADKQISNSSTDTKPSNCTICYETLLTSVGGMDASALTACGHWFCNECWTQHLRSRVKQGDTKIACPEFDCNTLVDKVLLLAYLTRKEYRTQSIHCRNTTLNTQQDWRWCPNTACGRMVKTITKSSAEVNSESAVAISCECGLLWCSSCKGEGHWPATCQQAAAYWKLIKKNGSVRWKLFSGMGDIQHVHVKKCPFCHNLIEKRDGCNYMYCVCHRAFCWDCLQDYNKHDWQKCRANQKKLQKVTIKQTKPIMTSMPGVALQHRERRTRLAVMKRRKAAEILAKKAFLVRQGTKEPSIPCLPDDTSSIASSSSILSVSSYKSLPMTWIQDDESSWQLLQELLQTAASAAKFCSEAEFCLEHVEVLCHDPNTELKSPATLLQLKDRLIFIEDQLHMILHGEIEVNADSAMGRVAILTCAGKKCLKWIAANIPLVLAHDDED